MVSDWRRRRRLLMLLSTAGDGAVCSVLDPVVEMEEME